MLVYNNPYYQILIRYQFNPAYHQTTVTMQILLKALMMLPNADFIMCRCLIDEANVSFTNMYFFFFSSENKVGITET